MTKHRAPYEPENYCSLFNFYWYSELDYDVVVGDDDVTIRLNSVKASVTKANTSSAKYGIAYKTSSQVYAYGSIIDPATSRSIDQTISTKQAWNTSGTYSYQQWTFDGLEKVISRSHLDSDMIISFTVGISDAWIGQITSTGGAYTADALSHATSGNGQLLVTIPAKPYAVTLDDGTSTTTLKKQRDKALALPQPAREGYTFAGWANSTSPATVVYQPGASYTANADASLVAVWTPIISAARISQLYAARDDGRFLWDSQTGTHTSASDDGEYVYIRAWWRVDGAATATVSLGADMADTSTVWTGATRQVSKPGTGELYLEGVAEWGTTQTALATGQYDVTVTLSTGTGNPSDSRGTTVSTAFFTIDVLAGGHGIAFGKPATQQLFDVGMETNFDHDVRVMGTPLVPIGTILDFAAATAPTGYLVCDGSAVSRTDYAALFAVIGTTWGAGDGSTTFNVPDFRGRTSIGTGTGTAPDATAHALGSGGGSETVTLTSAQSGVPAHSHPLANSSIVYNSSSTQRMATSGSGTAISVNTNVGLNTYNSTAANASSAHSNMTPYRTVTKIIRAI